MNDQEVINAYLKRNPLSKTCKNVDTIYLQPCIACGSKVSYVNKKPVTTFSGEMNSVYTDALTDFPRHEKEDLCSNCISKIKFQNSEQNTVYGYLSDWGNVSEKLGEDVDFYTDNIDADFLKTNKEYEGFKSYEAMEGTAYKLGAKDGEL